MRLGKVVLLLLIAIAFSSSIAIAPYPAANANACLGSPTQNNWGGIWVRGLCFDCGDDEGGAGMNAPAGICPSDPQYGSVVCNRCDPDCGVPCPVCGDGVQEGSEQCDEGPANGQPTSCCNSFCNLAPIWTQCRATAGACDLAETCDGINPTCPVDQFQPGGTGPCSVVNTCDASSPSCSRTQTATYCAGGTALCNGAVVPTVQNAPVNTQCSGGNWVAGTCVPASPCNNNGVVDPGEQCDLGALNGQATSCCDATCHFSTGNTCRASAGPCDVAETCSGSSQVCPVDRFRSNTVVCSAGTNSCNGGVPSCSMSRVDTYCPGNSATCSGATNLVTTQAPAGNQCSGGAWVAGTCANPTCGNGITDAGEDCDGGACCSPTTCKYERAGVVCRAQSGVCDVAEVCSGSSFTCPVDSFQPATYACSLTSAWTCEAGSPSCGRTATAQYCPGNAGTCSGGISTTRQTALPNTVCQGNEFVNGPGCSLCGNGVTNVGEQCDAGPSNGLPTSCCNEYCQLKPRGTVCNAESGTCDVAETCTGSLQNCPANSFAPVNQQCQATPLVCNPPAPPNSCSANRSTVYCGGGAVCNGATIQTTQNAGVGQQCSAGSWVAGFCGVAFCGDGAVTWPPEQCDGTNLSGYNCGTLGGVGTLSCSGGCMYSGCFTPNGVAPIYPPPSLGSGPPFPCLAGSNVANGRCCPSSTSWNGTACAPFFENTTVLCTNTIDDEFDTYTDYHDANPGVNPGQSCNVCNNLACPALNASYVPLSWAGINPPGTAGYVYINATAQRPGDASNLRMDPDGSRVTTPSSCWCAMCDAGNGYQWNASLGACSQTIAPPCASTTVTINNFTRIITVPNDPGTVILQTNYTVATTWPTTITIEYDTDGVSSTYEVVKTTNGIGTLTDSQPVSGLSAGSHNFNVRVNASCGATAQSTTSGTINAVIGSSSNPVINNFTPTVVPAWLQANASFYIDFQYSVANNLTLYFGDGTQYGPTPSPGSAFSQIITVPHNYVGLLPGQSMMVTATLNITDNANPARSNQTNRTFMISALDYVSCTPPDTHCPLPPGSECASDHCEILNSTGGYECVATGACFPDNGTVCGPPAVDRDSGSAACLHSSSTCVAYNWTTNPLSNWTGLGANPSCCGDDVFGEFNPSPVYNPSGNAACCSQAGMCFTEAGTAPGCRFPGGENNPVACSDGIDNDCDGDPDVADSECAPAGLVGRVWILDNGQLTPALGATVSVGTTNVQATSATANTCQCTAGVVQGSTNTIIGTGGAQTTQSPDTTSTCSARAQTSCSSAPQTVSYFSVPPSAISSGLNKIVASQFGYTTETANINLVTGNTYWVDFVLVPRFCNDDCTNMNGFCDRSCIGVGGCQPTGAEIRTINACHPQGAPYGLRSGQQVIVAYNASNQSSEIGLCCSVAPAWQKAPKVAVQPNPAFNNIDTLVKFTSTVIVNGRPHKMVINTW